MLLVDLSFSSDLEFKGNHQEAGFKEFQTFSFTSVEKRYFKKDFSFLRNENSSLDWFESWKLKDIEKFIRKKSVEGLDKSILRTGGQNT